MLVMRQTNKNLPFALSFETPVNNTVFVGVDRTSVVTQSPFLFHPNQCNFLNTHATKRIQGESGIAPVII